MKKIYYERIGVYHNKEIIRDRQGHYTMIKEQLAKKTNVHVLNNRAEKYVRSTQIGLKEEIDKYTIIRGDFSTSLSIIDRKARQKSARI